MTKTKTDTALVEENMRWPLLGLKGDKDGLNTQHMTYIWVVLIINEVS